MSALLSPLRRRPAAAAVTLGLLLLAGYGAYRVGRHAWADGHYRVAQRELHARDFAAARADLAVCLAVWPDDAATHLLAARAARRAGDLAEAERELATADGLGEPSADHLLERALLTAQQGDMRTAEPVLLASLSGDDHSAVLVYEVLAPAYVQEYRLYEALACLDRWEKLEPNYAQIPYLKGVVNERLRSRRPARDCFRRAVDLDPDLLAARLGAARNELALQDPAAAWGQLAVLGERWPDNREVGQLSVRCLRLLNRPAEARGRLDGLLARYPDDAELLFERGMLALDAGQPRDAEPALRRANEQRPSEREYLYQLARCLELTGKAAEAREVTDRLQQAERDLGRIDEVVRQIAAQPHNAALRCEAGTLMMRNGYPEEGRRWLESALAEDPRHGPTHRALAEYYRKRGDAARAEQHRQLAERFTTALGSPVP